MSAERRYIRDGVLPRLVAVLLALSAPGVPTLGLRLVASGQSDTTQLSSLDERQYPGSESTSHLPETREFWVTGTGPEDIHFPGPEDIHFPGPDDIEGTGIKAFVDLHHTKNDKIRVYKVKPTLETKLQGVVREALSYSLIKVASDLEVVVITHITESQNIDYGREVLATSKYITVVQRRQGDQFRITDSLAWKDLPLPENIKGKGMQFIEGYPDQPTIGRTREGFVIVNFTSGFIPRNGPALFVTPGITRMIINTTTGKLEPAQ